MNKKIILVVAFLVILSIALLYVFFKEKESQSVGQTALSINPCISEAESGQNFTIKINISDALDLYSWEFKLTWNATLLDAVDFKENSFLKNGGRTFFTFKINDTAGYILADCTLLGNVSGVSGNGTLATVKFYVKTAGECTLHLQDVILVNSLEQQIIPKINDGHFNTSP